MLNILLGKKVGMTQVFDENRNVIPVTAIDVGTWYVTQVKTVENDGYVALQIGMPRKRYEDKPFSSAWLKHKQKYFLHVKEVSVEGGTDGYKVGKKLSLEDFGISVNDSVAVAGVSRGKGFQGVVKRWGFSGGPSGHGSTFHRSPGSIGNMCSEGNVIKGKKLPGQCGCKRKTVKNLKVAVVNKDANCLFVKGAVPGKKETLLYVSKS